MAGERKLLNSHDAAKAIGKGCHKPLENSASPVYFEKFDSMISKLARNCIHVISEEREAEIEEQESLDGSAPASDIEIR